MNKNDFLFVVTLCMLLMLLSCKNSMTSSKLQNDEEYVIDNVIHAEMKYFDFDTVEDICVFFDDLASKHETLLCEEEFHVVDECLSQLERYRKGEVKYYPDSLVKETMFSFGLAAAKIDNHRPGVDLTFAEWFMMLAAYYSPDITYLVDMQSPDHLAGVHNFGNEYNYNPWWAYLFLKREKGYEVRSLGDDVQITRIFQLEDDNQQRYYLCTNYTTRLEFMNFLYWRKDSINVINVASCNNVNDIDVDFDSFYFNPQTLTWSYCREDTKSGKLIPVSEKPAMKLHLDGMNSKFITEF